MRLQNDESDWKHDEADPFVYRTFALVARNVDHLRPKARREARARFYKKSYASGRWCDDYGVHQCL